MTTRKEFVRAFLAHRQATRIRRAVHRMGYNRNVGSVKALYDEALVDLRRAKRAHVRALRGEV